MNITEKIKQGREEMNRANERVTEMTCAQVLVEMANREYLDALKSKDRNVDAAYTLALGRRRGIIMALEALGFSPTYDVETGLYHI